MPQGSKHSRIAAHPRRPQNATSVAIMDDLDETDMPFEEGAGDTLDPDLRHRMISEAAYHLYAQRGYAEGYELDDWLQAEAQVDHVAMKRERDSAAEEASGEGEAA